MIPVGAIVGGILAARAIMNANQRGQMGAPPPREPQILWLFFVYIVLVPMAAVLAVMIPASPLTAIICIPALLAMLTVIAPWPLARALLVPLGLYRLAYYVTHVSDVTWRADRKGGAALAAAWAILRKKTHDEAAAEWVMSKLEENTPLRGGGLCAIALLSASRGDLDGARQIFRSLDKLDERIVPGTARRIAREWLATDAASRGEWHEVAELGQSLRQSGRSAWFLSAVAQSLLLEPMSPGKLGLWLRWALAPRRRKLLPLVRRALMALDGAFIEIDGDQPLMPETPTDADALGTALALHAAMLSRPLDRLKPEDVRALGAAWDAALEGRALEQKMLERATVIGATNAQATITRFREAIEEDLAELVLAGGVTIRDLGTGEVAERVRRRVRDRLLCDVEAASDAIRRRVNEKRALPVGDEWREWTALREAYERGVRLSGDDFRRLAFLKVHPDACSLAVWLFNERNERPIANGIFRFLLEEATRLDDQRAITLQTKNVDCGI